MKWKHGLLLSLAFFVLFLLCLYGIRPYNEILSYPFILAAACSALAACVWRTRRTQVGARRGWILVCVSLVVWCSAFSIGTWQDLGLHSSFNVAQLSDFVFILYGVSMLFVFSFPSQEREKPLFLWLNGVQIAMTTCVLHVALFSSLPFSPSAYTPLPGRLVNAIYDGENLLLAVAATLRLLSKRNRGGWRQLYLLLTVFLWCDTACVAIYNSQVGATNGQTGVYDLVATLPMVLLAVLAMCTPLLSREEEKAEDSVTLSRLFDAIAPVAYTVGMQMLGVFVIRKHFYWGVLSLAVGLAVFLLRSTLLYVRLLHSEQDLRKAHSRLESAAMTDGLTGVANRRSFNERMREEWKRGMRTPSPLSLLMIDIDSFKALNDSLGHQAGDQYLIAVAGALKSILLRESDLLARYGGEEFATILPNTPREGAEEVASRMRLAIADLRLAHKTAAGEFLSVSIGISTCEDFGSESFEDLIEAADRALYLAKERGRNRMEYQQYSLLPVQ